MLRDDGDQQSQYDGDEYEDIFQSIVELPTTGSDEGKSAEDALMREMG